jgi:ABC-type transport system substrate-binding protein
MHVPLFVASRSRRPRLIAPALAALLIGTASLSACSSGSTSQGDAGVLTVGLSGEPQPLKAGINQNSVGYLMDALVHQGLLRYGSKGAIEPALAESYKKVNDSTYDFTLRPGLKFSDGTPLTPADVKKTFEFLADPANAAFTVVGMSNIDTITTSGTSTVKVKLKQNDPDFLEYVANPTAFIAKDSALRAGAPATVGAGPFVIDKQTQGVSMDLVANKSFYDTKSVKLSKIELEYYTDTTARQNALLSGDVDLIDYVATQDFDRLKATKGIKLEAQAGPLISAAFNVTKAPFANPLVRRAVAYAVNRDHVASAADAGNADPVYGVVLADNSPFATAKSKSMFSYDPAQAKKLLAEAGYPDGFKAKILTTSQFSYHQDTAIAVQADLKQVGIDITLVSGDYPSYRNKLRAGEYDLVTMGGSGVIGAPSYLESFYFGNAPFSSFGYKNDKLREALTEARTAPAKGRTAAYDRAFDLIAADPPRVDFTQRYNGYAYKESVQGFENFPGFLSLYSQNTLPYVSVTG